MPAPYTTLADLEAMVGTVQEGHRIEFKEDIPVHETRAREQAKDGLARPRDTWWQACRAVGDTGRDLILEEIVAFANAQGGTLVLGMEEEKTSRMAKALCPLPGIAALEARFRDYLVQHVEPRLSYCRVQGVPTGVDGSGVLVFEVEPSRLGPHWVRSNRRATVRRDDKCMPLSMSEIQEMTLRNARRFDEVRSTIDARLGALEADFARFLESKVTANVIGGTVEQKISTGLKQTRRSAFALRSVLVAHDDIGIPRIQAFSDLIPPRTCVDMVGRPDAMRDLTAFWPTGSRQRRFLGGVADGHEWAAGDVEYTATREGAVEATALIIGNEGESTSLTRQLLVGLMGCSFGIYDNLREMADRPYTPVEVAVSIRIFGDIHVANAGSQMAALSGGRLPPVSTFPRRSGADATEFSAILSDTAQDLLDAADSSVARGAPTPFHYYPREPA